MIEYTVFTQKDLFKEIKISKLKDGRYRGRLRVSYNTETREYKYKAFYATNELDVKVQVRDFIENQIENHDKKTHHNELLTTDIDNWLRVEKYGTIKGTSYDRLEQVYQNQIEPYIKGIKTKSTTATDCKVVLQRNLAKGYSYSTLLKVFRLLKEFFNTRVADGSIPFSPMNTVKPYTKEFVRTQQSLVREERKRAITKKAKGHTLTEEEEGLAFSKLRMEDKTEIRFLEDEEIEKIKEVVQNGYMLNWTTKTGKSAESGPHFIKQAEYFLFILNTGLRCGESIALKYSDVDFENRTIAIRRNITAVKNRDSEGKALVGKHMVIGSTKTDGSADVIPVNTTAITILKQMLEKEPKGYNGYIAHNDDYSHLGETALRKRFSNLLRQAKVESCGIHSLRHTFASKLYEISKGDSKLVSSLVRHSSVSFTEDTYIHLKQKYQQKSSADFSI